MAKSYAEARKQHGNSELLDAIVAAKPERDHTHTHSAEELKEHGLQLQRDVIALLQTKATPEEVDEYRRFIVTLSQHVAAAHREHGVDVSEAEQAAIDEIAQALGTHRVVGGVDLRPCLRARARSDPSAAESGLTSRCATRRDPSRRSRDSGRSRRGACRWAR